MKKLLLLSTFMLAVTCGATAQVIQDLPRPQTTAAVANAAVQEGNWIVGATIGNIGFNFKSDNFNLDINPRIGYFLSDNAAIGTEVQLGLSIYDGGEEFRYGLTPFVRYYFPEGAAPTHRWFGEAVAGFAGSSVEDDEGDAAFDAVLGLRAGYAHFVSENVAIEGILGYTRTKADISVGSGQGGLNLAVGLQVYLPGRGSR